MQPGNAEALTGLTAIDVTQKNYPAARARIDAALAKAPTNPDLLILAGRTYASVGDPAAAEAAFKKAIEVNPQMLQAYGLLGQLYVSQKRMDQALAEFDQLPEGAEGRDRGHDGGDDPRRPGQARARQALRAALQADPNAAVAANNLAYLYAEQEATWTSRCSWRRRPSSSCRMPEINDTLGFVYLKKDLATLAIPPLETSVRKDPQNWLYQYTLGLAYSKAGERGRPDRRWNEPSRSTTRFPDRTRLGRR